MTYKLYPLSSASGKAIPLDVLRPLEHLVVPFTASPAGAPTVFTSHDLNLVMGILYPTEDVTISFDPTTPVDNVNAGELFIPAQTLTQIAFSTNSISAISSRLGILHISIIELWDSLSTEVQQNYG